jgi:N-methylhydantoinase A/oxoprolinase/acetone carboxylase beta subunit
MTYRVAVDTGGTFSDVVRTSDVTNELKIAKALTTAETRSAMPTEPP